MYWKWSVHSDGHNNRPSWLSQMLLYEEMRHRGRNRQSYCFIILVSIKQRLQSESSGAGINQKVSILLAVAAGANKMIVYINNRPNSWASQRTRKGRRQKARHWIRRQFRIKWIPSSAQIYWSAAEVLWQLDFWQNKMPTGVCYKEMHFKFSQNDSGSPGVKKSLKRSFAGKDIRFLL